MPSSLLPFFIGTFLTVAIWVFILEFAENFGKSEDLEELSHRIILNQSHS